MSLEGVDDNYEEWKKVGVDIFSDYTHNRAL